jgi:hypothetical protein
MHRANQQLPVKVICAFCGVTFLAGVAGASLRHGCDQRMEVCQPPAREPDDGGSHRYPTNPGSGNSSIVVTTSTSTGNITGAFSGWTLIPPSS